MVELEFLNRILAFFRDMERGRRTRLIVLSALIIIVIIVVSIVLNQKSYSVLYSGMNPEDAGEVMTVLNEMNVDAKPRGDDTIMVESSQVDSVRMQLAAQGYPNSGFTFEIFQNAAGLGTTDMEKRVYLQFQYQENLRRTIIKMDKVDDAVVNITLPEESPFVLDDGDKPASAAVMLMLKSGQRISQPEVRAIAELVSKSVSGLELEHVRIVDSQMNLYSIEDETEIQSVGTQFNLQQSVQNRLQEQIISLLNPIFGTGKVIAEVNVILNFDSKVTESVVFTPPVEGSDEGIVISMKELTETIKNNADGDVVGLDANGGAPEYPEVTGDEDALYDKVSREMNLEVNETKTLLENAKGTIEDLSASVILDSSGMTADYTDNVKKLVATAIGVEQERITVEMMPFQPIDTTGSTGAFADQSQILDNIQKAQTLRYIIIAVAALLVMIFLYAIVRALVNREEDEYEYIDYDEYERLQKAEGLKLAPQGAGAGEGGIGQQLDISADEELVPGMPRSRKAAPHIDFEKKDTALDQLGEYIDRNPEDVAQLLKRWLYEDYN